MRAKTLIFSLVLLTACSTRTDRGTDTPEPAVAQASQPFEARTLPSTITANVPVLPHGLTSFGAVEHDGVLYVLGGYSGTPHAYSARDQHGELLAWTPEDGWSVVGEVPPVQGAALVSHASGLIRVGGMRALNATAEAKSDLVSIDVAQRFDPRSGTWSNLPALPEGRSSHDAVVLGDSLYVVGGWALEHDARQGEWGSEMFVLDLSRDDAQWERKPAPFARRALGVAVADGRIFALGGMDPKRQISGRVDVYDPVAQTWSRGPDFPGSGFGMAAVGTSSGVYASGADGMVHRLDPRANAWTVEGALALPRFFHRLVASEDETVWALGGIRPDHAGGRVRMAEAVAGEPASQPIILRVPSPMASKNRQGVAALGDDVYFFGGNDSLGQHDFGPENFEADAFRFDLASLEWSDVASYPVPRQTMSVATHEGKIHAFGGFGHDGEAARSHPEVFVYTPGADAWTQADGGLPGPRGRTQFGLAKAEGQWWVFGGLDYDPARPKGEQFRHEQPVLSAPLQLARDFEASGASLREPRRAFAGTIYDGRYVVVGGMKEGFELVDGCEAFDFGTKAWSDFPCPSTQRLSGHLVAVGDRLVLLAGSSKDEGGGLAPDPTIEVYEASTGAWTKSRVELPVAPKHLHAIGRDDALVLLSTHNDEGMLDVVVIGSDALIE